MAASRRRTRRRRARRRRRRCRRTRRWSRSRPRRPSRAKRAKAPKPAKGMSALDAAAKALAETGTAMTPKEMIGVMAAKGWWSSPTGKTPAKHALLGVHARGSTRRARRRGSARPHLAGSPSPPGRRRTTRRIGHRIAYEAHAGLVPVGGAKGLRGKEPGAQRVLRDHGPFPSRCRPPLLPCSTRSRQRFSLSRLPLQRPGWDARAGGPRARRRGWQPPPAVPVPWGIAKPGTPPRPSPFRRPLPPSPAAGPGRRSRPAPCPRLAASLPRRSETAQLATTVATKERHGPRVGS